jgi:hypothetical protein
VFCALLSALFAHAPASNALAASAQDAGRSRITTASGVRVRQEPDMSAAELSRLQLGVVVQEIERSQEKVKVGAAEDYWYLVSAPGGVRGWVFGGLTAPFDTARRDEIYRKLADERLANAAASFAELADLVRFLDRATKENMRREVLAELELARLLALGRSLASFSIEEQEKSPYKAWTSEREAEVVYSEPSGQWYVRAEQFWNLQRKYRDLPLAERIAWEAAQVPLPGECEGDLDCSLSYLSLTDGEYLKLYPHGAHADAALDAIAQTLDGVMEDLHGSSPAYQLPSEERSAFRKTLADLRKYLTPVASPKKTKLLRQLDELARRFH